MASRKKRQMTCNLLFVDMLHFNIIGGLGVQVGYRDSWNRCALR